MRHTLKKAAVGVALAAAAIVIAPAAPAAAINATSCTTTTSNGGIVTRTDVVRLISGTVGARCFANAGPVAVTIPDVTWIGSNIYKVTVNFEWGGRYYSTTVEPGNWQEVTPGPGNVYEVRIW